MGLPDNIIRSHSYSQADLTSLGTGTDSFLLRFILEAGTLPTEMLL